MLFETESKYIKFEGKAPPVPDEKTILLVGATGSGKSTLVDGFVNYIMGVSFDDPFRFTTAMLEDEEMKTHNQVHISCIMLMFKWKSMYYQNFITCHQVIIILVYGGGGKSASMALAYLIEYAVAHHLNSTRYECIMYYFIIHSWKHGVFRYMYICKKTLNKNKNEAIFLGVHNV